MPSPIFLYLPIVPVGHWGLGCEISSVFLSKNIQKYKSILEKAKEYEIHSLIDIYVKSYHVQEAWDLALKNKDQLHLVLYELKNAFQNCHLSDEVQKVDEMIKQAKNS